MWINWSIRSMLAQYANLCIINALLLSVSVKRQRGFNMQSGNNNSSQLVDSLPTDIVNLLSKYLGVDDRLSMISVNKDFHHAIHNVHQLLKLHFPDDFEQLKNQAQLENKQLTKADYEIAFQEAHHRSYQNLNDREKKLMSLFKKGDRAGIVDAEVTIKELFDVRDDKDLGLIDWALKNKHQDFLNRWFQSISEEDMEQPNWKFLWAILLEQSDEQIKIEFNKLNARDARMPLFSGINALHLAADRGRLNIIKLLNMEDVNLITDDYSSQSVSLACATPLFFAAKQGHLEIVNYLCEQPNINLNHVGKWTVSVEEELRIKIMSTPLLIAGLKNHWDVVDYLRSRPNIDISVRTSVIFLEKGYYNVWTQGFFPKKVSGDNRELCHLAASKNQLQLVQALSNRINDVSFGEDEEESPLDLAAEQGHLDIVRYLYEQTVSYANRSQGNYFSVLRKMNDFKDLLEQYEHQLDEVEEKAIQQDLKATNHIVPALAIKNAIKNNHLSVVRYFFEECRIKLSINERRCLSLYAGHQGGIDVIQYMHEHIEKINIGLILQHDSDFLTDLASEKKWNVLRYFYQMPDVNVDLFTDDPTLLRIAAADGQLDMVMFLCEHGVNVNAVSPEGYSALFLAVKEGRWDVVNYLAHLPNIRTIDLSDAEDNDYFDIIMYHLALVAGHEDKIKHLLVESDIDINMLIASGITLLRMANKNEWDIVKSLYRYPGINFNVNLADGTTLLHWLVEKELVDIVGYACRHGADVDVVNSKGSAPIHVAAEKGNLPIIKCLYHHGANIDAREEESDRTVLHIAAEQGYLEIAQYLCEKGVDVNATTMLGKAALHVAVSNDHVELFSYLVSRTDVDLVTQFAREQSWCSCQIIRCCYAQPQVVFDYLDAPYVITNKLIASLSRDSVFRWAHSMWGLPVGSSNIFGPLVHFFDAWLRDSHSMIATFWVRPPDFKLALIVNMLIEYQKNHSLDELKLLMDKLLEHASIKSAPGKFEKALQRISDIIQQELSVENDLAVFGLKL